MRISKPAAFLHVSTALLWLALAGPAAAAKSDPCAHCHGTDGNSSSSAYPSLAG